MPELPEVEIVRRGLNDLVVGKTIKNVISDNAKSFPNDPNQTGSFLLNSKIVSVERRAKLILLRLSTSYTLLVHLKMTGQLVFADIGTEQWGAGHPNDSLVNKLPDKSTRVIVELTDGSKLFFNDQRKFGWMKLLSNEQLLVDPVMNALGPEPLKKEFTNKKFVQQIRKRNGTTVKAAILDQKILAGVGNIYADESLWCAKINPKTIVKELNEKDISKLRRCIMGVLRISLKEGGSTSRNYVNAEGKKGNYLNFAKVYKREGQDCVVCGSIIKKIRVAGRGTHICPKCQP